MATITIETPDDPSDVPGAIQKINAQIAAARAQLDALVAAKRAIQRICKHPNMTTGRDYDGGSSSHCPTCEYSD